MFMFTKLSLVLKNVALFLAVSGSDRLNTFQQSVVIDVCGNVLRRVSNESSAPMRACAPVHVNAIFMFFSPLSPRTPHSWFSLFLAIVIVPKLFGSRSIQNGLITQQRVGRVPPAQATSTVHHPKCHAAAVS